MDDNAPEPVRRPSHSERRLLATLDEKNGWTAGQIARQLGYINLRTRAQLLSRELRRLSANPGWVCQIDDQKPAAWVRTPAGTEAMNVGG